MLGLLVGGTGYLGPTVSQKGLLIGKRSACNRGITQKSSIKINYLYYYWVLIVPINRCINLALLT